MRRFLAKSILSLVMAWSLPAFVMLDVQWIVNSTPEWRSYWLILLGVCFYVVFFVDMVTREDGGLK